MSSSETARCVSSFLVSVRRNVKSGAKIINVFRAWIGAQLIICDQK